MSLDEKDIVTMLLEEAEDAREVLGLFLKVLGKYQECDDQEAEWLPIVVVEQDWSRAESALRFYFRKYGS